MDNLLVNCGKAFIVQTQKKNYSVKRTAILKNTAVRLIIVIDFAISLSYAPVLHIASHVVQKWALMAPIGGLILSATIPTIEAQLELQPISLWLPA